LTNKVYIEPANQLKTLFESLNIIENIEMKEAPSYQVKKWKKVLETLKENTQENKKNKYLHEKKNS